MEDWIQAALHEPGRLAQSVAYLTANQGIAGSSSGPATFFRWDLVMNFYDHSHPSIDSRRVVVSQYEWALSTDKLPWRLSHEQCV